MIRKARMADAKAIHKLLLTYAQQGLMLSRSLADIYEGIRDFYIFEVDEQVVGTVCLHICWSDLAEVRSLAVDAAQEGRGIGRKPVLFGKLDFHEIEKSELPHKIWSDCIKCPKFPECDEIAMSIEFRDPAAD